jgi:hypothetical protein
MSSIPVKKDANFTWIATDFPVEQFPGVWHCCSQNFDLEDFPY